MAFWISCVNFSDAKKMTGFPQLCDHKAWCLSRTKQAYCCWPLEELYAIGFTITKGLPVKKSSLFLHNVYGQVLRESGFHAGVELFFSQFGTLALIVATIDERYRRHDRLWSLLFIVVLISEVFWGLISGMKGMVLQNFLVVALVSSYVLRKLNLRWFVILFFGLVLIYPVSNAYRSALNRGEVEVTSFGGAAEAGQMAFREVMEGGSTAGDLAREGLENTIRRLDLLTSVAQGARTRSPGELGERRRTLVDATILSLRSTVPLAVQTDTQRKWTVHHRAAGRIWRR